MAFNMGKETTKDIAGRVPKINILASFTIKRGRFEKSSLVGLAKILSTPGLQSPS